MREFVHVICDPLGLHARSCVMIAREATKWESTVVVADAEREADAKSMASLVALRGVKGDKLRVVCEGIDEADAASALEALMRMSL